MSDVSAEDAQNLRQLQYEEMQKIKSQLKEQDQKWQDVSILELGERGSMVPFLLLLRKPTYLRDNFPWCFSIQYNRKCTQSTVICFTEHCKNIEACLSPKRPWVLKEWEVPVWQDSTLAYVGEWGLTTNYASARKTALIKIEISREQDHSDLGMSGER